MVNAGPLKDRIVGPLPYMAMHGLKPWGGDLKCLAGMILQVKH